MSRRIAVRNGERGSALVIAVLVVVIMTLLGVSFLLMAETENRIADNEKLSAQALYFAESGVRMVKRWFDSPGSSSNLMNPSLSVVDRTLRKIDDDGDPSTATHDQDGSTWPRYKQGIDLDADGNDDVFDRPYRGSLKHTLLGIEAGPDMAIYETYSSAAKTFLSNLSNALLANFPAAGAGIRARITRIDVYAPPYVQVGAAWTRYGMATVKVTARIYRIQGSTETTLAERMIKAVLNETPYPGPFGPLHSCADLGFNGNFNAHWGVVSADRDSDLPSNLSKVPQSIPRVVPPAPKVDLLYAYNDATAFAAFKASVEGANATIEDPWYRYHTGGAFIGAPTAPPATTNQPYPYSGTPPPAQDHSNLFRNMTMVACPQFEYETWKTLATSGSANVHYFKWDNGDQFREDGIGTPDTFRNLTDQKVGFFFFDTTNSDVPVDGNGDGVYDNLTPNVVLQGGNYQTRGFVYANALNFRTRGLHGRIGSPASVYRMPGEPFADADQNGEYDAGEGYINLDYPTTIGGTIRASATAVVGGGSVKRDAAGPAITVTDDSDGPIFWGVVYNNGYFDATGNAKYYGSVITKAGVGTVSPSAGTPDLYWDDSLRSNWPPKEWELPRVIVTRWETDL